MSDTLTKMIMRIAEGVSQRPNFFAYTYKDDMRCEALLTVLKYLHNFNEEKSQNPFAYITQIIYNSFRMYINKQKKHSKIKNQLYGRTIFNGRFRKFFRRK